MSARAQPSSPPLPGPADAAGREQGTKDPIPLQVLIVEDDPRDVAMIVAELRAAGFEPDWRHVDTAHEFESNFTPTLDVVLSAYTLANIDPMWILRKVREARSHVPLVIVSGVIGDDKAAECLALGATDYVLKDRMARLGSAVNRAIEERKAKVAKREAEIALHRSEERMRGILATLQDVVWSLSLVDWKILFMSPAGEQMFGRPVAEFYENGQLWLDSVHPDDRERVAAAQKEMIRWGTGEMTFRILRSDGSIRHVHTRAWCAYVDGKPFRLEGINTDITERIDAAELLEHQHAALEEAQAIAHLGSWEWDHAKDVITFSKEGWRIWGLGPTVSTSSAALLENVHPEDREGFEKAIAATVAGGPDYDVIVRIETPNGERHTRHRGHVSLRGPDGKPIRLNGTIEDVTENIEAERRRDELEASQHEMQQLGEQNAFKSQFLNMVAHDLNNVVTPMRLNLHGLTAAAARGELPNHERAIEVLNRSQQRLIGFLADLLDAARLQSGKLGLRNEEVDLGKLLESSAASMKAEAEARGIHVDLALPEGILVEGDPGRIEQVVANLLSNALKFTPDGGRVSIALARRDGGAQIGVSDTGLGLKPDDLPKLFQPFSRIGTKGQGKHTGTGLGLFISRGIVESHGGRVWAESPGPGRGATFSVWLPSGGPNAAPPKATDRPAPEAVRAAPPGSAK